MSILLSEFQEALENFHRSLEAYLAVCKTVPIEARERSGVCGTWSPKQVIAHFSGWMWEEPATFRRLAQDPAYHKEYDEDAFNAHSVAERAALDWEQTLADFSAAYQGYRETLDEILSANPPDWRPITAMLKVMGNDFQEHKAELERWLL